MHKILLALLVCFTISSAHSYETGNYVMQMEGQNYEFSALEIADPYLKDGLVKLLKGFTKGELLGMYQIFPALGGFFHHMIFLKDNNKQLYCMFDMYFSEKEEALQCSEIRPGKPNEWQMIQIGGPGTGTLIYKGHK